LLGLAQVEMEGKALFDYFKNTRMNLNGRTQSKLRIAVARAF